MQVVEKTVEGPQLHIVEKTAETPETQMIQGAQTAETAGVDKIGAPLPTESVSPMLVSTLVLETPPVVECVHVPAAEYVSQAHSCMHMPLVL